MANGLLEELQYGDPGYIPSAADIEATPGVSAVGSLPMPPTSAKATREMQNRAAGVTTATRQPIGGQQQQSPFAMPLDQMNQLYGLMAGYADDPTDVGTDYIKAMQNRQIIDRENQPIEQFLRLYGNVNPFDWTAPSLQKFHDHYIKTGQLQFDLLEPKKALTSEENTAILDADNAMYKSGSQIGQIGDLVRQFEARAATGDYTQGIIGSADEWIAQNITGNVDDMEMLKQRYRDIKNQIVIQRLPPGVASDKDIAIAREGWPGPNVNPAYLAAFLRGVQKLEVLNFAYNMHKSYYIGTTQGVDGLSQSWLRQGGSFMSDAMAQNGLRYYNPKNPDGSDMSYAEAANNYFTSRGVGQPQDYQQPGATAPPQVNPAAPFGVNPDTGQPFGSEREVIDFWASR